MALVAGLVWLWRLVQSRRLLLPQHLRWPLGFLLAYLGAAALGALLVLVARAAMVMFAFGAGNYDLCNS